MTIRKTIFWLHLASGLTAGLIVAMMSATGAAIAFESEILRLIDRNVRIVENTVGTARLSLDQLDAKVKEQRPDQRITARIVPRAQNEVYEYRLGREGSFYVNPYSGEIVEPKSKGVHETLQALEEWHRWLGREGEGRATGKLITGIANLAFLFLCLSGLYMWWPRSWSARAWRLAIWFVPRLKGRARDFNWHAVFGSWNAIVLIVIVTAGVVISFAWAQRLVFAVVGEQPPARGNASVTSNIEVLPPTPNQSPLSRDDILAALQTQYPNWRSITFDATAGRQSASIQPVSVTVLTPDVFQARGRIQIAVDPYRGTVLSKIAFQDRSTGTRLRIWLRFLHTGEALGLTGKIIATIAALSSLALVYTGCALAYRRFFPTSKRIVAA